MDIDVAGVLQELEDRPGKQADGSSKTREMKLCALWTADTRDKEGRPIRDEGSITYTAAIESAETKATDKLLAPFAQRVEREATRRGFDQTIRKVAIGDGAPWLWNIVAEFFPDTIPDALTSSTRRSTSTMSPARCSAPGPTWAGPGWSSAARRWTRARSMC